MPPPIDRQSVLRANLLSSLQRLLKIGVYYHQGHQILDTASDNFLRDLSHLAGDNPSIRFHIREQQLFLEGAPLPENSAFVHDFRLMLDDLGVSELAISPSIGARDLHTFLQTLLSSHAQIRSSQRFRQALPVEALPEGVRIVRKEFLANRAKGASGLTPATGMTTCDEILDRLRRQGLSEGQVEQARTILNRLSVPDRISGSEADMPRSIDWEDVEQKLIKMVSNAEPGPGRGQPLPGSVGDLAVLLGSLEENSQPLQAKKAIELLLMQIKNPTDITSTEPEVGQASSPLRQRQDPAPMSLAELNTFLAEHPYDESVHRAFHGSTRLESLSILLQCLQTVHSLETTAALQRSFAELTVEALEEEEWDIILAGFRDILAGGEPSAIAAALRIAVEACRNSVHLTSLGLFRDLFRCCADPAAWRLVWPFALNEVIGVGGSQSAEVLHEVLDQLAKLPAAEREVLLPRLAELDSCGGKKMAADLVSACPPRHYPLLVQLWGTSLQGLLIDRVLTSFAAEPPDWVIRAVIGFLRRDQPVHQKFLRAYLENGRINLPSRACRILAGQILVDALRGLAKDQRSESAAIQAINLLPIFGGPEAEAMLAAIAKEKRALFLPEWPAVCRRAARTALSAQGKPS